MYQKELSEKLLEENKNLKYAISHMSKKLALISEALRDFDFENVPEEYTKEYFWMIFANNLSKGSLKNEIVNIVDLLKF